VTDAKKWAEEQLGYRFNDTSLLNHALTHRSAAAKHNERLEFLGDAVLELVITDAIYRLQPNMDEGGLSRLRSALVRKATLADIGNTIEVAKVLTLGAGEKRSGGHQRSSTLADTVEALLGAVYLDGGYPAAVEVITFLFTELLTDLPDAESLKDPKTTLQEFLQAKGETLPEYEVLSVTGKSHKQTFEVVCRIAGEGPGQTAKGSSRRKAEQQAAADMLAVLKAN